MAGSHRPMTITVDVKGLHKQIAGIADDQIPFATSRALTATARNVETALQHNMKRIFDRPVPWIMKSMQTTSSNWNKSTKRMSPAAIAIKASTQLEKSNYEYLKLQITGGLRRAKKQNIPIPKNVKRNGYGNIPAKGPPGQNKYIKKLLKDPNNFEGTVGGVLGIWSRGALTAPKRQAGGNKKFIGPHQQGKFKAGKKRAGKKRAGKKPLKPRSTHVKLLIRYEPTAPYKAIFPYYKIIEDTVKNKFRRNFSTEWANALATRKPK